MLIDTPKQIKNGGWTTRPITSRKLSKDVTGAETGSTTLGVLTLYAGLGCLQNRRISGIAPPNIDNAGGFRRQCA